MGSHAEGGGLSGPEAPSARSGYAPHADAGLIADARHRALALLDQAHADQRLFVPAHVGDLIQLVVSEPVTNAPEYAPGPVLTEPRITAREGEIMVWDSDPTVPVARAADPGRIGHHALEIVEAVTEDFFVEREPVGKRTSSRTAGTMACGRA